MATFISKTELESKIGTTQEKTTRYVGEIYPEVFKSSDNYEFKDGMPLEAAIIWLGAYQIDSSKFPREKCPICGKEEVMIPFMCGGSMLSGAHVIKFYCTSCGEQFVTNDYIDYFRQIKKYVTEHRKELKPSPAFKECSKIS